MADHDIPMDVDGEQIDFSNLIAWMSDESATEAKLRETFGADIDVNSIVLARTFNSAAYSSPIASQNVPSGLSTRWTAEIQSFDQSM